MKLNMNSINPGVFKVSAAEVNGDNARASIVGAGRMLAYEYARKGTLAMRAALGNKDNEIASVLSAEKYKETNDKFQAAHLLYAARQADKMLGKTGPEDFESFKRNGNQYYRNDMFLRVLAGIYTEIINPILPRVFSEAVGIFADVYEVGFGETYQISIGSNDIPVFQDDAHGAYRSKPRNKFYQKDYTLNPQPKTCLICEKWIQLVGNNVDFGRFFANIAAGMYAKTMGMWNAAMTAAISDTSLVPSNLSVTFDTQNWVKLANRLSAVNNTPISNIIAFGSYPALAQVLPTEVTGSTNVNMDAAIATLLGADYVRAGYLGEYMAIRLMPMTDVIIPGTQNTTVDTMLSDSLIYMMAGNGRRPMAIGMNGSDPLELTIDPYAAGDMSIGLSLTYNIDLVSIFADHIGVVTI